MTITRPNRVTLDKGAFRENLGTVSGVLPPGTCL